MARKLGALLGSLAMVVAVVAMSSVPAAAASATKVVQGHDLAAAGLLEFRDQCSFVTADNPPAATPLGLKGGTVGTHSIGWQTVPDFEVGALAPVLHPTSLNTLAADLALPSGAGGGRAVAFYFETPNATDGYWFGYRLLNPPGGGFAGTGNVAGLSFNWSWIEPGNNQFNIASGSIPWLATNVNGDGGGAYVGFLAGCEGQPFYADNLRVGDGVDYTQYDFEGAPSASRLGWNVKGNKVNYTDVIVPYGQKLWLLGDSYDPIAGKYIVGAGTLSQQAYGTSGPVLAAGGNYSLTSYAAFKVAPKRQTTYWFGTDGTNNQDSSGSAPLTVKVVAGLNARISTLALRPGQHAIVKGKLFPGDKGTKVSLQQKAGGWRTIDHTKTGKGGRFSVSVRASRPGKMILRLSVGSSHGVLGGKTRSVTVTVSPRPQPHHGGGGGGGGGGGSSPSVSTAPTASVSTTPPTLPNVPVRLAMLTKATLPAGLAAPADPPTCHMPGVYALAPCPPGRND